MNRIRNVLLGLAVSLAASSWLLAGDEQQPRKRPLAGGDQVGGPLVPKAIEEKLNLSADQKDKIAKIEKEFADKTKDTDSKIKEMMAKARQDKDRAAMKKILEQVAEARKVRTTYETQVQALLTPEQKKVLEQASAGRPGRSGRPEGGQLLPQLFQGRLDLTAEQKEKLQQLQKEFEGKALQVLTEEQRKKIEEFKARRGPQRKPRP